MGDCWDRVGGYDIPHYTDDEENREYEEDDNPNFYITEDSYFYGDVDDNVEDERGETEDIIEDAKFRRYHRYKDQNLQRKFGEVICPVLEFLRRVDPTLTNPRIAEICNISENTVDKYDDEGISNTFVTYELIGYYFREDKRIFWQLCNSEDIPEIKEFIKLHLRYKLNAEYKIIEPGISLSDYKITDDELNYFLRHLLSKCRRPNRNIPNTLEDSFFRIHLEYKDYIIRNIVREYSSRGKKNRRIILRNKKTFLVPIRWIKQIH
jgi:hypothetical protein